MTARVWPFISHVKFPRSFGALLIVAALFFSSQLALAQFTQQGPKLVGTGAVNSPSPANQGQSVALSGDGNTAIMGGSQDNSGTGATWVFTRGGGVWTQQGSKLVAFNTVGGNIQGQSVALSADGNTAIVGAQSTPGHLGGAFVYTRSNGVWAAVDSPNVGQARSVALSGDGNTAIMGEPNVNSDTGAAWVFTRSGTVWTQQGSKLVGTGAVGNAYQGDGVALSGDGNTAIVGGSGDNVSTGATWVFTRSNGVWTQQGNKLVGTGAVGRSEQGVSVALSADGNTAIVGGQEDNSETGAAWVFVRSTAPSLQVTPATNMVASGNQGGPFAPPSFQYQLSATTGSINYSISGYPNWLTPSSTSGTASTGTAVTFNVNANASGLAVGSYGPTPITFTNSDTSQGTQTRTATLTVKPPALQVTPASNVVVSGTHGGPFTPSSFSYTLSATYGSVNYSITNIPSWLTLTPASSKSGTATTSAKTITFKIDPSANKLPANTYINSISFNNTTNNQGNTTRVTTLTVTPK